MVCLVFAIISFKFLLTMLFAQGFRHICWYLSSINGNGSCLPLTCSTYCCFYEICKPLHSVFDLHFMLHPYFFGFWVVSSQMSCYKSFPHTHTHTHTYTPSHTLLNAGVNLLFFVVFFHNDPSWPMISGLCVGSCRCEWVTWRLSQLSVKSNSASFATMT